MFSGFLVFVSMTEKSDYFEKHLNKYNVISFDMQKFLVKTKNVEDMLAEMEEEKRRMEDKASKLQQRKGSASKYNDKIEKLDK